MGYKRVILHIDDARKLIDNHDWTVYKHVSEYIEDIAKFGLRPYKKDIRPASTGSGIGVPRMNHYCIKKKGELDYKHFRYIIIDQRKWMVAKIQYGI